MKNFRWKENKVFSITLRNDYYVLAQMLKAPYIVIYNIFSDSDEWSDVCLSEESILFCKATTKQLFKRGVFHEQKMLSPLAKPKVPSLWIKRGAGAYKAKVWPGTADELEFVMIGEDTSSLIKRDIYAEDFSLGEVVKALRQPEDDATIDECEMNDQVVYPSFIERLYLCGKLGRNVDPEKELIFNRPLNPEYKTYFKIISGKYEVKQFGYCG
ncbi:MAG: hypothetical protein Marn2KO_15560 [Marinobacter nauticus]